MGPKLFQAGEYEFKIIGSDGGQVVNDSGKFIPSRDDTLFNLRIRNVNRPPKLSKIKEQFIFEGKPIQPVN